MHHGNRSGILITGGTGYLAQGLVRRLLELGETRICIYSRNEYAQARMRVEFDDNPLIRWFIGDVRDRDRLERAMLSVDRVIHAAALKRIEVGHYNPEEMVKTNIDGSMNVIEAARRTGVSAVVFTSSDKAFEPCSPYGQSKAIAERLFLSASIAGGPRFAVTRYGNVAGSTGSVIPTWRALLARKDNSAKVVRVTDPDCTRFWMSRDQAVNLVLDTLTCMSGGELIVPKLPAYRLADLANAMGAKALHVTGLGEFEKKHESMAAGNCSADATRLSVEELREMLEEVE